MIRVLLIMCSCLLWTGVLATSCAPARNRSEEAAKPPLSVVRTPEDSPVSLGAVPREGAGDLAVARVGGAEIRRSDVGDFLIRYYREEAGEALTHLVDERIIAAEARVLGIAVSPELVSRIVDEEISAREARVRVDYGSEVSFERYLREKHGVTLARHRSDLGRLVETRLLRDRVVRFRRLTKARVEVRDAVFASRQDALLASRAARGGADLGLIAADRGSRPEVALPPFARDEISPQELADRIFELGPGEVSDPIEVVEDGERLYHVFKVVRVFPPRDGEWSEVRGEIEAELEDRPVEAHEYMSWVVRARERYGMEILR